MNWTSTTMVVIDLRRTCETMLASLGLQKDMRAQVQSRGIIGIQDKHTPGLIRLRARKEGDAPHVGRVFDAIAEESEML